VIFLRCNDLDKIEIQRHRYHSHTQPEYVPICAMDTETSFDGYARLVTWCAEGVTHHKYITKPDDVYALFNTMLAYNKHVTYFYNIGFDMRALLKWILKDLPDMFFDLAVFDSGVVTHRKKKYRFQYIPDKSMNIQINRNRIIRCFDLAQFFNMMKLKTATKKYVNDTKKDYDVKNMAPKQVYNDKKLLEYGRHDAYITWKLGRFLHKQLSVMGLDTMRPISKATIAHLKMRQANHGQFWVLPNHVTRMAFNAYSGGRFETIKRGFIPNAIEEDLNSAYPKYIADLPHIMKGKWKWSVNKRELQEGSMGFAEIKVCTENKKISPLTLKSQEGLNIYPRFKGRITVTGKELELLDVWPDTSYEVLNGWVFYDKSGERPFSYVKDLYRKRQKLKARGDPLEMLLKIIMNSTYGKFLQITPKQEFIPIEESTEEQRLNGTLRIRDGEGVVAVEKRYIAGSFFNPVYAATITANTRCKILDTVRGDMDNVVGFATDAVFLEDKVNIPNSKRMGEFSVEGEGDLIMVGNGVYSFGGEWKARGFRRRMDLSEKLGGLDGCVSRVMFELVRPLRLKSAFRQHRFEDMNQFLPVEKMLDFNSDRKRVWPRSLTKERLLGCVQDSFTLPRSYPMVAV